MKGLLVAVLLAAGCASGGGTAAPTPEPMDTEHVLPVGKDALPVEGQWFSPLGFVPPLTLQIPAGWTSTHRGDDAFDLSRPDPAKDAPLVAVVLLTPREDTAAAALTTLRTATSPVTSVTDRLGNLPAAGFDVVGGSGALVASTSGTVALDRAPGQHARIVGIDVDGVPLLAVVVVPDGARWAELLPVAQRLLAGVIPG